jgi:uncharacterized protein YbjT (DUF2867 family)
MSTHVVLGGTGKVGSRIAGLLEAGGHDARVASRRSETSRFDWHDESSWASTLDHAESVFIVGPGSATDWTPRLAAFLEAAHDAGVARAVLLSARGVEFLPDGIVAKAERTLMDGAVPWTILRPSHFAQNFTEAMFVPVDGKVISPVADGAEPFIDVVDIAEVAAVALTSPEFENEILELSGPSALTFDEAVAALNEHSGSDPVFESESHDDHVQRLRDAGTPELYITWRMAMLDGIRSGADAYLSDGVERVLGRPATSFTDWMAREIPAA